MIASSITAMKEDSYLSTMSDPLKFIGIPLENYTKFKQKPFEQMG